MSGRGSGGGFGRIFGSVGGCGVCVACGGEPSCGDRGDCTCCAPGGVLVMGLG